MITGEFIDGPATIGTIGSAVLVGVDQRGDVRGSDDIVLWEPLKLDDPTILVGVLVTTCFIGVDRIVTFFTDLDRYQRVGHDRINTPNYFSLCPNRIDQDDMLCLTNTDLCCIKRAAVNIMGL